MDGLQPSWGNACRRQHYLAILPEIHTYAGPWAHPALWMDGTQAGGSSAPFLNGSRQNGDTDSLGTEMCTSATRDWQALQEFAA
jgi:hypothetical protein